MSSNARAEGDTRLPCRCINSGSTLQQAIAESLQSSARHKAEAFSKSRSQTGGVNRWPVWRKNDLEEAGDFYTIRVVKGQRQVVKRRSAQWYAPLLPGANTCLVTSTPKEAAKSSGFTKLEYPESE